MDSDAPAPAPDSDDEPVLDADAIVMGAADRPGLATLLADYGRHLAALVGVGLLSGSLILVPSRAPLMLAAAVAGALLVAVAAILPELAGRDPRRLGEVAGTALAVALGFAMVAGSVLHFEHHPARAGVLLPAGLALSLAGSLARRAPRPSVGQLVTLAPWLVIGLFLLHQGLGVLAGQLHPAVAQAQPAHRVPAEAVPAAAGTTVEEDAHASAKAKATTTRAKAATTTTTRSAQALEDLYEMADRHEAGR